MLSDVEFSLALISGLLLLSGLLMWRGTKKRQLLSRSDQFSAAERERFENSPEGKIHQMEVRLYEYGREVEGRVETTLSLLDRLIIDAQAESDRLEKLLQPLKKYEPLTAEQEQRIGKLKQAGLTTAEIARCLECNPEQVSKIIDDQKAA